MLRLLLDLLEWEELLLLILLAGRETDRLREPFSFASATSLLDLGRFLRWRYW